MPRLTVNTTNLNKLAEYERILGQPVSGARIPVPELQMESGAAASVRRHRDNGDRFNNAPYLKAAAELADSKARSAYALMRGPVLIEDTAIFLHGLCGEPGPFYSQWGSAEYNRDLCARVHLLPTLLHEEVNDRATAVVTLAMWSGDPDRPVDRWQGVVSGRIAETPRGDSGFGWDSIFIPLDKVGNPAFVFTDPNTGEPLFDQCGNLIGKTFAELTPDEKDLISMRAIALRKFLAASA